MGRKASSPVVVREPLQTDSTKSRQVTGARPPRPDRVGTVEKDEGFSCCCADFGGRWLPSCEGPLRGYSLLRSRRRPGPGTCQCLTLWRAKMSGTGMLLGVRRVSSMREHWPASLPGPGSSTGPRPNEVRGTRALMEGRSDVQPRSALSALMLRYTETRHVSYSVDSSKMRDHDG